MGTYLGPRAFYTKDMERKERAHQRGDLPPRCAHCRVSWDTVMLDGIVHCDEHRKTCDMTCGRSADDWDPDTEMLPQRIIDEIEAAEECGNKD